MRTTVKVLAFAVLAAITAPAVAWSADDPPSPLVGTWLLNIGKSTFDPPSPLKAETLQISDSPSGGVHQIVDYQEAGGPPIHMEFTTMFDGIECAVTGNGEADAVVASRINPKTFRYVFKKSGKEIEKAVFTVSDDEKTLEGPIAGNGAKDPWKYHYLFDRERQK